MDAEDRPPAPEPLGLVQQLVNTLDREAGVDALEDPQTLSAWLAARGLGRAGALGAADLERARALREALRTLLLVHGGATPPAGAAVAGLQLAAIAQGARLVPAVTREGAVELRPAGQGVDALVGAALAAVHEAQATGTWTRLKACPAASCGWAFYDRSRNRSGTWCAMAECGSRAKARRYQGRLRAARRAG